MNVIKLGKAIVERVHDGDIFAVFPDGEVAIATSARHAERLLNQFQKSHTPKDGAAVMEREWRNIEPLKQKG